MRFQFKLWILICLNVYLDILGLVHGLHIRSPCNSIDNSSLSRYCLIQCNFNTKNGDSYSLKNPFSNLSLQRSVKPSPLSNVLSKSIYNNFTDHIFKKINHKNISQFSFITYRITDGFKTRTLQAHRIIYENEDGKKKKKSVKEFGGIVKGFKYKDGQTPVYKNEMDKLIDLCTTANHLYEKHKDVKKVNELMGIKHQYEITSDTIVCLARSLLNRPAPPKDYFGKLIHELGFLILYNNIKNMMKEFIKKVENKISPKEEKEFPRNYEYAFGIEPLSFGEKVAPLSEVSIRGFLNEKYFEHIEQMAKYNPKRAQKILTVIHRLFRPTELRCENDEGIGNGEILLDLERVFHTYIECIRRFIKDYPHLKWPLNDDEHLDLYRTWFDPTAERSLKLSKTIKEHFLDNFSPESDLAERYIVNPLLGAFSGLVFGKGAEWLTDYLYSINPDLFGFIYKFKKKFKYLFGLASYFLTSETSSEPDYFYEVLKVLYEDVKTLEDKGVKSLMQSLSTKDTTSTMDLFTRLFKGSSEIYKSHGIDKINENGDDVKNSQIGLNSRIRLEDDVGVRNGEYTKDPRYSEESEYADDSDLLKGIINFRRESLIKLADQNGISYRDYRKTMEKVAQNVIFHSFVKLLTMFRFGTLHESDPKIRNQPEYEEFSDDEYDDEKKSNQNRKTGFSFVEEDVEIVTLPPRPKPSPYYMDPGTLDEMYKMIKNLRYIMEVCIPPSKTSVYRLMYNISCYMAMMDNLPKTIGNEVLGYYISGEDFIENNMTPEDDYSTLYRTGEHLSGLPPIDVKKHKYTAMMLSCFFLQVFSNMNDFVTCTSPPNFGRDVDTDHELFKSMGVSEQQLDVIRKIPPMPSTLDEIEEWALKLNDNEGYIKREKIEYKYGIIPKDEYTGETPEQIKKREKYELENMRCYLESLFKKNDKVVEIVQGLSLIFSVSEKFMFKTLPGYWLNFVANWIYRDLDNVKNNFDYYIKVFNMSEKTINEVRKRVIEVHFEHLRNIEELEKGDYLTVDDIGRGVMGSTDGSDGSTTTSNSIRLNSTIKTYSTDSSSAHTNTTTQLSDEYKSINKDPFGLKDNVKDKDEEAKEIFDGIKKVCNKLDMGQDMVYDYYRIFTFKDLINDLKELDFTNFNKKDLEVIKKRYESTDIVFVNGLCEVIKEKTNNAKKSLFDAVGLEDYYLIEKHVQTLINMRRALLKGVNNLIDKKYLYRIERALQHNKPYLVKEFKYNEILGRDKVIGESGPKKFRLVALDDHGNSYSTTYSTDSSSVSNNSTSKTTSDSTITSSTDYDDVEVLKFGKRVVTDELKSLDGDWELKDKKNRLTIFERKKLFREKQERRYTKPLPVYGVDTNSDYYVQNKVEELIEKGELPEEYRCIPNEFHIGRRELNPDYDLNMKLPEDKYKDKRAVLASEDIFKAWVIYTYRKRKSTKEDAEDFKAIFPGCAKMVDYNIKDWKHLYVRSCIRNDDINSVRDWYKEMYPDDVYSPSKKNQEEVKKVLEYCYDEELLRATKGPMEDVENDIGNVEDFYFCAPYPSTNLRINYIFSQELPNEKKIAYLEKIQKFLKISPKSLEYIHSRRFHYALGVYFRNMIQKNEGVPLKTLVNQYFKPISQKLSISQETYTNVLSRSVYEHVVSVFHQYFDNCPIGDTFLRHVDRFLQMCNKLEIISSDGVSKFSPSLNAHKLNVKVIDYFILSSMEVLNKVDMDKLNLLCDVIGLRGEEKKKEIEELGRSLYYKHMLKHHKDENIFLETFDELSNIHYVYGFNENHFRKIIYDFRLLKMLDMFDNESGLDVFKKSLDIVLEDDVNKYLNLNKDSKTHWFMNIMSDLIENNVFDITEYLQLIDSNYLSNIYDPFDMKSKTGSIDESRNVDITCDYIKESIHSNHEGSDWITSLSNKSKNAREEFEKNNKGFIDFLLLLMDKLQLSNMQLMEACFHFVDNNTHKFAERLRASLDDNYRLDYEFIDKTDDPNVKVEKSPYLMLVNLLKVLSLTPKNTTALIKSKVGPFDTKPLREILIENSHSLDEQKRTLKLLDLYLAK